MGCTIFAKIVGSVLVGLSNTAFIEKSVSLSDHAKAYSEMSIVVKTTQHGSLFFAATSSPFYRSRINLYDALFDSMHVFAYDLLKNTTFLYLVVVVVACCAHIPSCHRTALDAKYWTIRTLFIAVTTLRDLEESAPA